VSESDQELMGRNEYARHRGVAPHAVSKAIRTGRIARAVVYGPGGKVRAVKWRLADQLWLQNTDPVQSLRSKGLQAARPAGATEQPPGPDVWTARALGRAVALARVDVIEECKAIGFLDDEPLTPSELLDLVDVFVAALAERLQAAIGKGPADAVHDQVLDAGRPGVLTLTLEEALALARGAVAKAT